MLQQITNNMDDTPAREEAALHGQPGLFYSFSLIDFLKTGYCWSYNKQLLFLAPSCIKSSRRAAGRQPTPVNGTVPERCGP